jgi:hypothetical protein
VQRFGATDAQAEEFKLNLVKAMAVSCIPFNFASNEYLHRAMAVVGISPISRKQVAGKYLDGIAADEIVLTRDTIEAMDFPSTASDGWRQKYCADGASLMNFTVMGNSGEPVVLCFNVHWSHGATGCTEQLAL